MPTHSKSIFIGLVCALMTSSAFANPSQGSKVENRASISAPRSYPTAKPAAPPLNKEQQRQLVEAHQRNVRLQAEEISALSLGAGERLQSLYHQAFQPSSRAPQVSAKASFRNGGLPAFGESVAELNATAGAQVNRWDSLKDYGGENFGMSKDLTLKDRTYSWENGTYGPWMPRETYTRPGWAP